MIREHDKDTHLENTAQEMLKYGLIDEWQKDEFKSLQNQDRSTFSKEDSIKYKFSKIHLYPVKSCIFTIALLHMPRIN